MVNWNTIPKTVPQDIIEKLREITLAMTDPDKSAPNNGLWKNFYLGDPDDHPEWQAVNAPFVAVEEGDTNVQEPWIEAKVDKDMDVIVHFRFAPVPEVEPRIIFGYYLGRLQSTILADARLGGTCKHTAEVASSPQVFTRDNLHGGFLAMRISYRTPKADPYTLR